MTLVIIAIIVAVVWWGLSGRRPSSRVTYEKSQYSDAELHELGAPPHPWPPRQIDRRIAECMAELFNAFGLGAEVTEVDGPHGKNLEVGKVHAAPNDEPFVIFSRIWSPDDHRVITMLCLTIAVSENEPPVIQNLLDGGGFRPVGPLGTIPSLFVSSD